MGERLNTPLGKSGAAPAPPWFICLAVVLSLAFALAYFLIVSTSWRESRMVRASDQATFVQGFYNAVHGQHYFRETLNNQSTTEGFSGSYFSVHLSPIFYLFLPAYALWPSPLVLLSVSALGVATAGMVVLLLGWRIFGSAPIALGWYALFVLHPVVSFAPVDGFRASFVAVAFLSLALLFYVEGNGRLFLLALLLAMLSKEDVALLLPVWGLVALYQGRGRRLAASTALLGIGYFVVANMVVLPIIRTGHPFRTLFNLDGPLGQSPGAIIHSILIHPRLALALVLSPGNLYYWTGFFGPLLFLPVLGLEYLVIPAYVYAEVSFAPILQSLWFDHGIVVVPFAFLAAMVGARRLVGVIERVLRPPAARAVIVRAVAAAAIAGLLLAGAWARSPVLGAYAGAPSSRSVRGLIDTDTKEDYFSLLRRGIAWALHPDAGWRSEAFTGIPPRASLAASESLVLAGASRESLALIRLPADLREWMRRGPDYFALDLADFDNSLRPQFDPLLAQLLCGGAYGLVYQDNTRILLARGADVSANGPAYHAFFPETVADHAVEEPGIDPHRACPAPVAQSMDPQVFARAAALRVRSRVSPAVRSRDTFPEPVVAQSDTRYSQVTHLPDQVFDPGWYRLDVAGAWPWLHAPRSYEMTARILVGERVVGQVTAAGDQPLRYSTPPFRVDRRGAFPIRVQAELRRPAQDGSAWAFRPSGGRCAVVADSPGLNAQAMTVEASVFLEGMYEPPGMHVKPGVESEAPILNKGGALGYYLRLSGDSAGRIWVDLNVAGKWAAGRAGFVPFRTWTHIAATYDGEAARIYLDGLPATPDPWRNPRYRGTVHSAGVPLLIGCRDLQHTDAVEFQGRITGVRVWNRVLSAGEIYDAAGLPDNSPGLVGSWDFATIGDGKIPDLSPGGNHVTNGAHLTRAPAPDLNQPFFGSFLAWRSRQLNLVKTVTVRRVTP